MKKVRYFKTLALCLGLVILLAVFASAGSHVGQARAAEGKIQLEETLRRTAAACYAAEGVYPPNLAYMQEHYGLRIDEKSFAVDYRPIASNLMPEITVLELK